MAGDPQSGPLMDLEKELSCSICTDVLYQPLTLLDCLHTFCGACLKEWFSWQAQSATTAHPYTCPSCRASVRATQPNATVTTLLDMFLHANPSRGKTDQEKDDMRKVYKPGDNVLPKLRRRRHDDSDEDDRRMLEEVRLLSLQEVGVSSSGSDTLSPPTESRRRNRSREREERRRRARDASASRGAQQEVERSRDTSPRPRRVIEHQASLRSLLSTSDFDSQEMEEEIMRQIREDGLLDGIDLENIDASQEEEITERIAAAFPQAIPLRARWMETGPPEDRAHEQRVLPRKQSNKQHNPNPRPSSSLSPSLNRNRSQIRTLDRLSLVRIYLRLSMADPGKDREFGPQARIAVVPGAAITTEVCQLTQPGLRSVLRQISQTGHKPRRKEMQ
ncbi:putative ring finger domain-containing protein [Lasiodiplodia theobromae]|nr:putative ring finger domain-containing protein [Lasiodiplodia theobromae]